MKNNTQFSKVKLLAGDDQRYTNPWWFTQVFLFLIKYLIIFKFYENIK